jgi:hypothetical protein
MRKLLPRWTLADSTLEHFPRPFSIPSIDEVSLTQMERAAPELLTGCRKTFCRRPGLGRCRGSARADRVNVYAEWQSGDPSWAGPDGAFKRASRVTSRSPQRRCPLLVHGRIALRTRSVIPCRQGTGLSIGSFDRKGSTIRRIRRIAFDYLVEAPANRAEERSCRAKGSDAPSVARYCAEPRPIPAPASQARRGYGPMTEEQTASLDAVSSLARFR